MEVSVRVATGAVFVWLGMVLAISFLEAPLKFRAPGVTLRLGLGIGRLVFRALNMCELLLVFVIAAALFTHEMPLGINLAMTVAGAVLFTQVVLIRPLIAHRTESVLAGEEGPRSTAHYFYIALEFVKVVALIYAGVLLGGT